MEQRKQLLYVYDRGRYYGRIRELLESHGLLRSIDNAADAIKIVSAAPLDLIVTDILLPPGLKHRDDPELARIVAQHRDTMYEELGLGFIRRVRKPESLNKNTHIIVATIYEETESRIVPDAREKALRVGANAYICLGYDGISKKGYDALGGQITAALGAKGKHIGGGIGT